MKHQRITITAGTGPLEVRKFVAHLARRLERRCRSTDIEISSTTFFGDESAPKSVTFHVQGDAKAKLGDELGSHVLLWRSSNRSRRSRKRWFASISMSEDLQQTNNGLPEVKPTDLEIAAARAGGPGGQHVNTTSSAVRMRHIPSGITVRVAERRSQHQNRQLALRRLREHLAERDHRRLERRQREHRELHHQLIRGNPVRTYRFDHQGELTPTS